MSNFILTLKLNTEIFQEDVLDKRFNLSRLLYNSCLSHLYKQYNLLKQRKIYKKTISDIMFLYREIKRGKDKKAVEKEIKEKYKLINDLYKEYGLNEYALHKYISYMTKQYSENIDSFTAQKTATRVWNAFSKMLFGNADKVYFKKYNELNSVEGKSNNTGIRFKDNKLLWNGLKIPVIINKNDLYAIETLNSKVKYCRVLRKLIRGKYKYFIQLILEGIPPVKYDRETGEIRNPVNSGRIGIDIGTQTIAVTSDKEVKLLELAPMINKINRNKVRLQRKLDRQRRANNPENYNPDGTIKRGKKLKWKKSKGYIKTKSKIAEIDRKQSALRKQSHEVLANKILSLGDEIYVEDMNFKALQKRVKKTTISTSSITGKSKYNKKKRFGKSLANKAPSMLLTILNNKLRYSGKELNKVNTREFKASQYNHTSNECKKKELSTRWNKIEEDIVQRDLYSSFLLKNSDITLEKADKELCDKSYEAFKVLHDLEIERLKGGTEYKRLKALGVV